MTILYDVRGIAAGVKVYINAKSFKYTALGVCICREA